MQFGYYAGCSEHGKTCRRGLDARTGFCGAPHSRFPTSQRLHPSQEACPNLPTHLWAIIAGHALAAADGPVAALKMAATLLAVSHDVSLPELLTQLNIAPLTAT